MAQKISSTSQTKAEAWTAYTPTVTSSVGTITSATAVGKYTRVGKTIHMFAKATITNNGTGSGAILITTPSTANTLAGTYFFSGSGREDATSGNMLSVLVGKTNAAQATVFTYNNNYPATTGAVLHISCTYEEV